MVKAVWEDGVLYRISEGKNERSGCSYEDNLGKLDWIMVARPPRKDQLTMVPMEVLHALPMANRDWMWSIMRIWNFRRKFIMKWPRWLI